MSKQQKGPLQQIGSISKTGQTLEKFTSSLLLGLREFHHQPGLTKGGVAYSFCPDQKGLQHTGTIDMTHPTAVLPLTTCIFPSLCSRETQSPRDYSPDSSTVAREHAESRERRRLDSRENPGERAKRDC